MTDQKSRIPTSFDVARLAGVSRSAVSRAFTDGAQIAEETRAKIHLAADQLGYRVNAFARGLQSARSDLVGLVASRLDTPIRSRQIKLLSQGLLQLGFRPMLVTAETGAEMPALLRSVLSYNVAGMIVTSDSPPPEITAECARREVPVVLINRDRDLTWGDRVQIDPEAGGRLVHAMLHAAGARRFACVRPARETFSVTGRTAAFAAAAGPDCLILRAENQSYAATRDVIGQVLTAGGIDGLFCATDLMALGGLDGLRFDHHRAVPDDIQVVGFDDIEQAGWASYNLTTVRQDLVAQSDAALDLLVARLADPDRPLQTRLQTLQPVLRATTRKPLTDVR